MLDSFISWIGKFITNQRATRDKRDSAYNSVPASKSTEQNYHIGWLGPFQPFQWGKGSWWTSWLRVHFDWLTHGLSLCTFHLYICVELLSTAKHLKIKYRDIWQHRPLSEYFWPFYFDLSCCHSSFSAGSQVVSQAKALSTSQVPQSTLGRQYPYLGRSTPSL